MALYFDRAREVLQWRRRSLLTSLLPSLSNLFQIPASEPTSASFTRNLSDSTPTQHSCSVLDVVHQKHFY